MLGGGLEEAVCPSCTSRAPASARFCPACGARMHADEGERLEATVLFADLSGFTSFSEDADPEAVRALAQAAAARFGGFVEQQGGTVDKIIGDCVMASFGAAAPLSDAPERAVRAALAMLDHAAANPHEFFGLSLSIGVHTGEVMYAPVGPQGQNTVLGDTVNIAAKLQGAAAAGDVVFAGATKHGLSDAIEVVPGPPVRVGASEEPTWRAIGIRGEGSRRGQVRSRFVGRASERRRLAELWERARTERAAYFVCIAGDTGIGKTRLLEEFRTQVGPGALIAEGRCLPYGEGMAYWPMAEIIKSMAGIAHDDDDDAISAKLGTLLEDLGLDDLDQLRTIAVAVANLVAAPTTPRGTYSAERISRAELHWGIRRLLELRAATQPIVLIIEGLTWAEPALRELLGSLVDGRMTSPLLVIGTARASLIEAEPQLVDPRRNRRAIVLEPLDDEPARHLLDSIGADPSSHDALVALGNGNPLMLEECAVLMAAGIEPPSTLSEVIGRRLDALPAEALEVAGAAALVGRIFWEGAIGSCTDPAARTGALALLRDHDLIRRRRTSSVAGEVEHEFRHAAVVEAAAARLQGPARARAHAAIATWVAQLPGAEREFVEFMAYHHEQACLADPASATPAARERAVDLLRLAARKVENREGTSEAVRWYERALALAGDLPAASAELRIDLARRLAEARDIPRAAQLLLETIADEPIHEREDLVCSAHVSMAIMLAGAAPDQAREHLERARPLLGRTDPAIAIRHALITGNLKVSTGEVADGIAELREAAARAERSGDRMLHLRSRQYLAWALMGAGSLAEAQEHYRVAAALARAEGSLRAEIAATWVLTEISSYLEPLERAEALAKQTLVWLERSPDPFIEATMCSRLASICLARDDLAEAERWARRGYEVARGAGGSSLADAARHLAQVFLRHGRTRDAERMARVAAQHVPEGDARAAGSLRLLEAYLAAARGDGEGARAGFQAGIDALAMEPLERAETRVMFARALRRLGDGPGAREQLERARDAFDSLGAATMVEHVDRLLAESG